MVGVVALSVEYTDLGTAVTASLRSAIVSGELPTGDRLVETDLAEQFGVSRGPIRDALAELERTGLVELRARKGSFVRSLTAVDVEEVYSLRTALESLAIRRAVENGADCSILDERLVSLESAHASGNGVAIAEADMALHRAVVQAGAHSRLLDAWERLADQTLLMMTNLTSLDSDIQGPSGSHADIVDAMKAGDGDSAVAALTDHLASASSVVVARYNP